jgi:hypothetical protein
MACSAPVILEDNSAYKNHPLGRGARLQGRRVLAKDESADQQFRYLKSAEKLPTQSSLLVVSRLDGEQWRVESDDC